MDEHFSAAILDYLRKNQSFEALRIIIQADSSLLQPVLQDLGEGNVHLKQLIEEHQADFLRLIHEPVEGQGNPLFQLASAAILDHLRKNQSFKALRLKIQEDSRFLQPVLQGLGGQNALLKQLIEEHQADFLRLIYEPVEGQGNPLGQLASAAPEAVSVDLGVEEHEAIEANCDQEDLDGEDHKVSRSEATKALNATGSDLLGDTVKLNKVNDDEDLEEDNDEGVKTIETHNMETLKNRLVGDTPDNNRQGKKKVRRAGARRTRARKIMREHRQMVQPTPLLPGLNNHPSMYIRRGEPHPQHDSASQDAWIQAFKKCSNAAQVYKELLEDTGFGDFLRIQPFKVSSGGYMTDLVERYFPETHTVHLGTFEIGPTPLAWTMITGIRFRGDPLNPRDITVEKCAELLGFEHSEGVFSNGKLKLDVLCSTLDFSKSPIDKDLGWMFRRLIVYFVGSCFFSGADFMVPIRLVSAMSDIRNIGCYDWGAATFSAFLKGMRQRTSEVSGSFSGFWPFLLLWAYEHIPYMRPLTYSNPGIFPRACRWNSAEMDVPNPNDFYWSRLELEYLREDEVNFDPYGKWREHRKFQTERSLSEKRIAFQGLDSWEVYMGERNIRQFGGGIRIPQSPPAERFGEISPTSTTVPEELLHGIDAWDLLMDEECDYAEWFRSNSLGRIIDLNQFPGKEIMDGRLLELWLRVHRDGYEVISPQKLQALEDQRRVSAKFIERVFPAIVVGCMIIVIVICNKFILETART